MLSRLIERSAGVNGVKILCHPFGGVTVETVCTLKERGDIILSTTPMVTTDRFTLMQLDSGAIDFSQKTNELLITRDSNQITGA